MNKFEVKNFDGKGSFNPEEYLAYRMNRQKIAINKKKKKNLIRPGDEKRYHAGDKQHYQASINDMKVVDKLNKKLAIIIPTFAGQLPWLKACLESCKSLGYFILITYDNSFYKYKELSRGFPPVDVISLADSIVMKHRTWCPATGTSHFWNMIYGLNLLKGLGFEYAFNMNGDCILEKPENFPVLLEMLGDADLLANHTDPEHNYMGTMGWIGKIDLMEDFFIEYANEQYQTKGTTEGRLALYVKKNNIKINRVKDPKQRFRMPEDCTWYNVVGFRHLHAEHKVRKRDKLEPVEQKYFDERFAGRMERTALKNYWETGDKQSLQEWWG